MTRSVSARGWCGLDGLTLDVDRLVQHSPVTRHRVKIGETVREMVRQPPDGDDIDQGSGVGVVSLGTGGSGGETRLGRVLARKRVSTE